jgi:hypothetical protein
MIEEIAAVGGAPSQLQTEFVDQVRLALLQPANDATEWS